MAIHNTKGISAKNRQLLDELHRGTSGPFIPTTAATVLSLPLSRTRTFLAYLVARKWLTRIRRGLYATVPLGTSAPSEWREDPWVVAVHIFPPCYVGGWSAAEHWGLTEQIFRDVIIVTAKSVRARSVKVQDAVFQLKHQPVSKQFGTKVAWRGQTKVRVSDPSRTLIDTLDDPRIGGGIRHIAEMLITYFDSEHRNDRLLIEYAGKLGNRAVFKRLGFLLEHLNISAVELVNACSDRLSSGLSSLDPWIRQRGRITRRWRLRVNVNLSDVTRPR